MTLTILDTLEQGTPEWHDQRRGMLTASVVGQLITAKTVKPAANDTSRGLTAKLIAERITGWTEHTFTNDDMWRGIESEPLARDLYARIHGVEVTEVGFMVREIDGNKLGYSPDGLVGSDGLIEVKSPRPKGHIATVVSGQMPLHHMAQVQAGLLVSGRSWCDFISYHGGLPMWVTRIEPDPKWHEVITEVLTAFEATAAEQVATYTTNTEGLPMTERLPDTSGIELKLS